jgi:hypothetical protein
VNADLDTPIPAEAENIGCKVLVLPTTSEAVKCFSM